MTPEFLERLFKNHEISNFMKTHPVGMEMFHEHRWTDRYDKANSCFSQFCICT